MNVGQQDRLTPERFCLLGQSRAARGRTVVVEEEQKPKTESDSKLTENPRKGADRFLEL